MKERMMETTPYPYVNAVLEDLLSSVRRILRERFVGLYLYGSLAAGDFDPARSDIDFVVVTRGMLSQVEVSELEQMHRELAAGSSKWAGKLEGVYMPLHVLRRYEAQGPALPTINEGRFYLAGQGGDWVIQRYTLREHEAIVAGPSLKEFIDPVTPAEMRQAVSAIMQAWWTPMLADPTWLDGRPEYQAFAVQTMCRVLYTLQFGTAVSKTEAAKWASGALAEEWKELVEDAIAWPERHPASLDRVLDFIRFTGDGSRSD